YYFVQLVGGCLTPQSRRESKVFSRIYRETFFAFFVRRFSRLGLTEAIAAYSTRLKITPTRVWTTPTG
ncbi:hypothetical protein ABLO16_05590, partial [Mycobacterium tuberculosis]